MAGAGGSGNGQQAALPEPGDVFNSYTYYVPTEKEHREDPNDLERRGGKRV